MCFFFFPVLDPYRLVFSFIALIHIVRCLKIYLPWASAENFPRGQSRQFASLSGCWRCNANRHTQKRFTLSTPQRKCPKLRKQSQKLRFVGSSASFHPI